jgi:hypothetical protein
LANEKTIKGVFVPRHDTALNWSKAKNFIPAKGELIVYDADSLVDADRGYYLVNDTAVTSVTINGTVCEVLPSSVTRFKFGNGVDNVNILPYVTTKSSGGGSVNPEDLEGYATEDWVKDYVHYTTGAVVYLSTQEKIGRYLELPDVYPVQADNPALEIISKNMINVPDSSFKFGGSVNVSKDTEGYVVLSGTSTRSASYLTINNTFDSDNHNDVTAGIKIKAPGKYTISVDSVNHTVGTTPAVEIHCKLFRDGVAVINKKLDITEGHFELTLDSRELAFDTILPYVKVTGAGSLSQCKYRFQIEPGDKATAYTPYCTDIAGRTITSYGKNLFNIENLDYFELPKIKSGYKVKFGNGEPVTLTTSGAYYIHSTVENATAGEQFIVYDESDTIIYQQTYMTPFHNGDEYTFSFVETNSESLTTVVNLQLLIGHVAEAEYIVATEKQTTTADINGICDYSILQYPYCFLALADGIDDCRIYVRFDPALTRDWTEKQLAEIDSRIDGLENGNIDIDLDEYATKSYVDDLVSNINDDIIVSETEPVVENQTIWLQPLTTDTGAVDYIVEQGIQNSAYYEKWNSGIVKYYLTESVSVQANYTDDKQELNIPLSMCKSIITHHIQVHGSLSSSVVAYDTQVITVGENLSIKMTVDNKTAAESVTLHHAIIGFWK